MYKAIIYCLEYSAQLTDTIDDIGIDELINLMKFEIERLKTGRN